MPSANQSAPQRHRGPSDRIRYNVFAWLRPKVTQSCDIEGDYSQNSDRSLLMAAAQAGDASAYHCLLREIVPEVRALLLSQQHPSDRIDDTICEVLRAIHRLRHTYDPVRPFGRWLASIARQCARKAEQRSSA